MTLESSVFRPIIDCSSTYKAEAWHSFERAELVSQQLHIIRLLSDNYCSFCFLSASRREKDFDTLL